MVVKLSSEGASRLVEAFPAPEFYVSDEAAEDAVRRRGQFNIIQSSSGFKIDVMVAAMGPFDRSRFMRVRRVDAGGFEANLASPEDAVVKKLVYFREGGSEKHLRDIANVLRIQGDQIDRDYVAHWAGHFEVSDVWQVVLDALAERGL